MKKILMAVLALVVILIALVLAHPLWIGPVVRTAVSTLAPKFLGVPAQLDGFSLNAYTGRVAIDGFVLSNPPGCTQEKFVGIGHLVLDVDPASVCSDTVVVDEISVADLYVSIVTDEKKVYNYETVANACSPAEAKEKAPEPKPVEEKKTEEKPSKKVIIDLIQVQNALVQWERVPLPLPSFRMTGLGRGSDGMTFEAAWKEFEMTFVKQLGPLAQGLVVALEQGQSGLNSRPGKTTEALKAAADVSKSVDSATRALNDLSNATKDGSQQSADAAAKSVGEAVKTIDEGVKSLKSLLGK